MSSDHFLYWSKCTIEKGINFEKLNVFQFGLSVPSLLFAVACFNLFSIFLAVIVTIMWFKLSFLFSSFLRKVFLRLLRFFFHRQKPANSNLIRNGQALVTFLHSKISLGFLCVNNLGLRCVIVAIVKFGFVCWSSNILFIPKWLFSH